MVKRSGSTVKQAKFGLDSWLLSLSTFGFLFRLNKSYFLWAGQRNQKQQEDRGCLCPCYNGKRMAWYSGLFLPKPMKWKWKSLSHVRLFWPHGLYSPWNFLGQNTGAGSLSFGDLPSPGIKPKISRIAGGFFTSWATREALPKPVNPV